MIRNKVLTGVLLDEATLTVEELAHACAVEPRWVEVRVQAGLLNFAAGETGVWRFASAELVRARRLVTLERTFEANEDVAALVVDLIEEVQQLRTRLQAAGVAPQQRLGSGSPGDPARSEGKQ